MQMKTNRKNLFEYIFLAIFVMCMSLALSAALEYNVKDLDNPYLYQGIMLLLSVASVIVFIVILRILDKLSGRISRNVKRVAFAILFGVILVLAFYLRYSIINYIELEPESDFETYFKLGELLSEDRLMSKEGLLYRQYVLKFPHTIGYPSMVLSPLFSAVGVSVKAGLYANMVFSIISVALVYFIVRQRAGYLVSAIAMLLTAVWPSHVLYSTMLASEPFFTMLILGAALIFAVVTRRDENSLRLKKPIITVALFVPLGVLLGIANAVRPMAMVLMLAMAIVIVISGYRMPRGSSAAPIMLSKGWLCAIIVFICYFITSNIMTQNVRVMVGDEPAGGITASGYNLLVGTNYEHGGIWNEEDAELFDSSFAENNSAAEAHGACLDVALERIKENPKEILDLTIYKFRDLWQTDDFGIDWNILWLGQQGGLEPETENLLEGLRPVTRCLYFITLVFVLIAAIQQWWQKGSVDKLFLACLLFFLGTALLHMVLETQVRYHYNMLPFFIIMAAFAMEVFMKHATLERVPLKKSMSVQELSGEGSGFTDVEKSDDSALSFDMEKAVKEGNILISVSENSAMRSGEKREVSSFSFWDESEDKRSSFNNPEAEDTKKAPEKPKDIAPKRSALDETENIDDMDDDSYIPKRGRKE